MKPSPHSSPPFVARASRCRQTSDCVSETQPRQLGPIHPCHSASPARPTVPGDLPFHRNPALEIHRLGTGLLLINPASGRSRRLDALHAFVWYLLKDPTTVSEAIAAIRHIRPDLAPARVRSDTERLFHELHTERMIVPDKPFSV